MLTQNEIPCFITVILPQVKKELPKTGNIYHSIQVLTDYTKTMAIEHNLKMVEKCISVAAKIYEQGNALVKSAVENVFIFSFSSLMAICNIVERRIVKSYMPSNLYSLYVEQVLRSKY